MTNAQFQTFLDLFIGLEHSIQDGELIVKLNEASNNEEVIKSALENVGYSFDKFRTIRGNQLHISLNVANWVGGCPVFDNWIDLYAVVENSSNTPEFFYIVETKNSSVDNSQFQINIKLFCLVRKLLVLLSDHCEPASGSAKGSKKVFLIIEADDGIAKYEFSPSIDWEELQLIHGSNTHIDDVEKLIQLNQLGDSQDTERRSVMRSAFHELISVCHDEKEIFGRLLSSITHFKKRYDEHYELFVKRFSINKVLHEINDQDLSYTSKINEILSSAQNKALAIPGALIVIGAVMRIDQVVDGLAVAIGILVTTIIVHRSLGVHNATFSHIEKQVTSEFKRYDVLNEDVEIRKQANQTRKDLKGLLRKAKANSSFMRGAIWFICAFALGFILYIACNIEKNILVKTNKLNNEATVIEQPVQAANLKKTVKEKSSSKSRADEVK